MRDIARRVQRAGAQQFRAAHRKQLLGAETRHVHSRPLSIAMADCQVDVFAREIDMLHRRADPQIDFGMRFGEASEAVHKPFGGEVGRSGDGHRPGFLPLQQALRAHSQAVERVAHHFQIGSPGVRNDEPLSFAAKQAQPQFGLEALHLLADRALRHAQLVRRFGEALMAGGCLEGLETIQRG